MIASYSAVQVAAAGRKVLADTFVRNEAEVNSLTASVAASHARAKRYGADTAVATALLATSEEQKAAACAALATSNAILAGLTLKVGQLTAQVREDDTLIVFLKGRVDASDRGAAAATAYCDMYRAEADEARAATEAMRSALAATGDGGAATPHATASFAVQYSGITAFADASSVLDAGSDVTAAAGAAPPAPPDCAGSSRRHSAVHDMMAGDAALAASRSSNAARIAAAFDEFDEVCRAAAAQAE